MQAVEVSHLKKAFGATQAVADVSFAVEKGEIFGLLGPNGAGKTTTIRMLTGQLRPQGGWARVAGCDVVTERDRLKPRIGVVFEEQNLYLRMTGRENLAFVAQLYGVDDRRVDEVLAQVGLEQRSQEAVKGYSNGMKQRLLIARALLHQPQVLFLDEPTKGLDPDVAHALRALVIELASQGMTVCLTTHYMEEADQLCRRVAIMDQGRIVALDAPQRLKVAYGEPFLVVTLRDGTQRTLVSEQAEDRAQLVDWLARDQVLTLHSGEASLEEVFIKLTGRRLAG